MGNRSRLRQQFREFFKLPPLLGTGDGGRDHYQNCSIPTGAWRARLEQAGVPRRELVGAPRSRPQRR